MLRDGLQGALSLALVFGLAVGARAASVPTAESFESYANGYDITNAAAWSGEAGAGIVTNDAEAITALTTYTNAGGAFPLPNATHTNVLELGGALTNTVGSATGGVVISELLIMPAQRDDPPAGSTNYQFACYVNTNDQLVVWHRDPDVPTNQWLTLSGNPSIASGEWVRVTIVQDFGTDRYQVAIDGIAYTNAVGENRDGARPGSWFHMVQTNSHLTRFRTEGEATAYLDDMVFTNRSVSYSAATFFEATANDGSVATTNTITLSGDTFVETTYSVGTHFSTSGVPAGLSVALAYVSPTQIEVSLTGTASPHTAADGTNAMGLTLEDALFTLGNAADVSGSARSDLTVTFDDPPVLSYNPTTFVEGVANNGSIGNSVSVTLTGDTFAAGPFVADTHFSASGVPAGLTAEVTRNNATNVTVTLTDSATSHGSANSTNMTLVFLDDAFTTVAAANITESTKSLDIDFADAPILSYSTTTYSETAANDGSLSGGTIALAVKTFAGAEGTNYVLGGEVLVDHLPAGLEVAIVKDSDYQVSVSFSGTADAHTAADGTNNLTFTFQDAAFNGGGAAGVTGYARSDLAVVFNDPPVLDYSTTTFTEASANNGSIGNSVTATLTGDTLTGGARTLASPADYAVTGGSVPAGLALRIVSDGSTGLTISLDDNATSHAAANPGAFTVTFSNALFSAVAAANITGGSQGFTVSFDNQPTISYSRTTFSELNAGTIDNTTPMEITISGDTFTGVNGSDFVAAGKVTHTNVPNGLTLVLTKSSSTKLLATLTGAALAHGDGNDVLDMGITFKDEAITAADADQVTDYARSDLQVLFDDSALFINTVPYRESFEPYADGYELGPDEGWQPSGGGVVTSETAIVSALIGSFSEFPITTNHTQVLRIGEETTDEIRSGSGGTVYTDTMLYIVAREEAPSGSTNYQFAMFVDTNQILNVWHRDTSGTPTNTWAALSGVTVTTGAWHRVTVEKDYATGRYRLFLDGSETAVDNPSNGSRWFTMVGTANGYLSRIRVLGTGAVPSYLDDLVVDTARPDFIPPPGTLFRFR